MLGPTTAVRDLVKADVSQSSSFLMQSSSFLNTKFIIVSTNSSFLTNSIILNTISISGRKIRTSQVKSDEFVFKMMHFGIKNDDLCIIINDNNNNINHINDNDLLINIMII